MEELIVRNNPKSSVAEAIRVIRTNIQFSLKLKKGKTILVTSSVKGEGKSFISSNLAVSFAQNDLKVLIIDSDLRLGRLHEIFKTSNQKGLSKLLLEDDLKEYKKYVRETKVENLYFIPRGVVPPNPSELLDSDNLAKLIEIIRKDYNIIIFDGTPINGLNDSLVLTKNTDSVVIVSSTNYTKFNLLDNTIKSLKKVNANIAGVILNKVPNKHKNDYYGYYYYTKES